MRKIVPALVLALAAAACGGGDGGDEADTARFCEVMQEFVTLAEDAISGAATEEADLEALTAQVDELISEAEDTAPEEISDIIDSSDPADQETITQFVEEECGVELPDV